MKNIYSLLSITFLLLFGSQMWANIGPNSAKKGVVAPRGTCQPGVAEIDQQINNVRARLRTGGDVWWDGTNGLYIVPKPAEGQAPVSAIFAGGVWVGGMTRAGNIKLAGVTYRSLNDDYDWYPGPLDENGATDMDDCANWDRFFTVYSTEVLQHLAGYDNALADGRTYDCDSIPDNVKYWPGKGNPYWREKYDFDLPAQSLGAFWDEDADGIYDPCSGDFPTIEIRNCGAENRAKAKELVPDEMIFWIYNDNGGPHRLTSGDAIQMEVQVQAFAYQTNDQINDMTFQRYKLINRANEDLIDCYFAMWVDPDLGCYVDDYVGADVERGLAYTYNVDALDGQNGTTCPGGVNTYGDEIPIIGTDYFRGPRGPKVFVRNQDGSYVYDENGHKTMRDPLPGTGELDTLIELGMTSFIYANNCQINSPIPATCDPANSDIQFYNNLKGLWIDGTPITFGGDGYNPGSTDTVKYVFPDDPNDLNGWSMCTEALPSGDRRTLQATGPLLLQPGTTNELIIGVVFVPNLNYPCPDISRLLSADDLAQALFINCFDITDGPDAPDIGGVELDREIILALSNDELLSNNAFEGYNEVDLKAPELEEDNTYKFEGYKIYQLVDAGVSPQELDDIEKARVIYQVDERNEIGEIYNWTPDANPFPGQESIWSFTRKVQGTDEGIRHTFRVLEDQFAKGDRSLINHKQYHFMVLAYAYNNYEDFNAKEVIGQRTAYLEGRRNVKVYSFLPRPIVYENLKVKYGDEATVTRLSGQGSGGQFLDLAPGVSESIIDGSFDGRLTYQAGAGPISVKVFNPFEVKDGKYRLEIKGDFDDSRDVCSFVEDARWELTNLTTNEIIASEKTLYEVNEQIVAKQGFSIIVDNVNEPGVRLENGNGAVGQTFEYKDSDKGQWFNAVPPGGTIADGTLIPSFLLNPINQESPVDPNSDLGNLGSGMFYPFALANAQDPVFSQAPFRFSPAWLSGNSHRFLTNPSSGNLFLKDLNNVDIVMTSDKNLWSRCIVVETSSPYYYNNLQNAPTLGETENLDVRNSPSVGKNGLPDDSGTTGYGWFPGYAIDVETGDRLNIFFGENTSFSGDNEVFLDNPGITSDMIFNPSGQLVSVAAATTGQLPLSVVLGGHHYIYVTRQKYDECASLHDKLGSDVSNFRKFDPLSSITWTSMAFGSNSTPMLSVEDGLVPNDLTIKLRVDNPYSKSRVIDDLTRIKRCEPTDDFPVYEFEFKDVEASGFAQEEYKGLLENVNIVPNPYYAYSAYENSQFSNIVKVTNLPARAIVTIYTMDGKFVRQYNRDERTSLIAGRNPANASSQRIPDLEWDMKNAAGIPVASGVYLIHVAAPELGEERTLKWFGVNRKFDPSGL